MSVRGDITPPVPSRQRIGKATASTDSDQNKKIFQKNKELTTNQELYGQNNRLATHQCPHKSITSNSTLLDKVQRELGLVRTTRHQCAVVQRHIRYWNTEHGGVTLELPSTNIFWIPKDLTAGCAPRSTQTSPSTPPAPDQRCARATLCQRLRSLRFLTGIIHIFESLFGWTSETSDCTVKIQALSRYKITIFPSLVKYLDAYFRYVVLSVFFFVFFFFLKKASHL